MPLHCLHDVIPIHFFEIQDLHFGLLQDSSRKYHSYNKYQSSSLHQPHASLIVLLLSPVAIKNFFCSCISLATVYSILKTNYRFSAVVYDCPMLRVGVGSKGRAHRPFVSLLHSCATIKVSQRFYHGIWCLFLTAQFPALARHSFLCKLLYRYLLC